MDRVGETSRAAANGQVTELGRFVDLGQSDRPGAKMKAARLYGPGDIRVEDVSEPPAPGAGEVLLGVTAVGICGSDLHYY
jgi:hypothetical protein